MTRQFFASIGSSAELMRFSTASTVRLTMPSASPGLLRDSDTPVSSRKTSASHAILNWSRAILTSRVFSRRRVRSHSTCAFCFNVMSRRVACLIESASASTLPLPALSSSPPSSSS